MLQQNESPPTLCNFLGIIGYKCYASLTIENISSSFCVPKNILVTLYGFCHTHIRTFLGPIFIHINQSGGGGKKPIFARHNKS